jgi:hypothetical protein
MAINSKSKISSFLSFELCALCLEVLYLHIHGSFFDDIPHIPFDLKDGTWNLKINTKNSEKCLLHTDV